MFLVPLCVCLCECAGERTRALDGAHVEYFRGLRNPVGVKVGPSTDPGTLVALLQRLWSDPAASPGRVSVITRMGAGTVGTALPALVAAVAAAGLPVLWLCDPMHGNTTLAPCGAKTRAVDVVVEEVREAARVHAALGSVLAGVHLEVTPDDVTECTGGPAEVSPLRVRDVYTTACDPRLNRAQSLHVAAAVGALLVEAGGPGVARSSAPAAAVAALAAAPHVAPTDVEVGVDGYVDAPSCFGTDGGGIGSGRRSEGGPLAGIASSSGLSGCSSSSSSSLASEASGGVCGCDAPTPLPVDARPPPPALASSPLWVSMPGCVVD